MKQLKREKEGCRGGRGRENKGDEEDQNKIERKRKARRRWMMRARIDELEVCYQKRDTRKYWNQLKQVGGWCRKGGGRIPDTAVDEKGEEYTGQDVLRVWRDSFFQLGVENLDDQDFDLGFAQDVEAAVKRVEQGQDETEDKHEEEEKQENEEEREKREKEKKARARLSEEITQKEVDKAISN